MKRILACLLLCAGLARADVELEAAVLRAELGRGYDHALLRRAAAAPTARTRRAAARAAGRLKDPRAKAWLLDLLRDPAGPVRRSALFALGQIGGPDLVVPLRAALGRLAPADMPSAVEAIGRAGDARAVSTVTRMLAHADARVRGEAALALFRLRDPSALPDVFAALNRERDDEARWRLVYAGWRLLRDRAAALAGTQPPQPIAVDGAWVAPLVRSLASSRPRHERVFAVRALALVAGQRAAVEKLLRDADARLVQAAVLGLVRPWDKAIGPKMLELLRHDDLLVREAALTVLTVHRKEAGPLLKRAATILEPGTRLFRQALVAAAEVGHSPALPATSEFGEETVWRVNSYFPQELPASLPRTRDGQVAAAEVCATERIPKQRALEVLLALLDVDDFVVRSLAIQGLAARGGPEHATAIVAAAIASPGTANADVRQVAAEALQKLKRFDPWLRTAALDPDHPVRDAARKALEELERTAPPRTPRGGFRLHGHDAAGIANAARALRGARVRLKTSRGEIEMVLLPDEAPAHCVSFAALIEQGFYDGLTWHRVVGNFVIQGGCPRGDGWGGPGYMLPDEIGTRPYVRGTVGMPKSGDHTGGCQIFITHLPTPHLDGRYTVFAQVVAGLAVMDRIRVGDTIVKASIELGE